MRAICHLSFPQKRTRLETGSALARRPHLLAPDAVMLPKDASQQFVVYSPEHQFPVFTLALALGVGVGVDLAQRVRNPDTTSGSDVAVEHPEEHPILFDMSRPAGSNSE